MINKLPEISGWEYSYGERTVYWIRAFAATFKKPFYPAC